MKKSSSPFLFRSYSIPLFFLVLLLLFFFVLRKIRCPFQFLWQERYYPSIFFVKRVLTRSRFFRRILRLKKLYGLIESPIYNYLWTCNWYLSWPYMLDMGSASLTMQIRGVSKLSWALFKSFIEVTGSPIQSIFRRTGGAVWGENKNDPSYRWKISCTAYILLPLSN